MKLSNWFWPSDEGKNQTTLQRHSLQPVPSFETLNMIKINLNFIAIFFYITVWFRNVRICTWDRRSEPKLRSHYVQMDGWTGRLSQDGRLRPLRPATVDIGYVTQPLTHRLSWYYSDRLQCVESRLSQLENTEYLENTMWFILTHLTAFFSSISSNIQRKIHIK